MATHYNLPPAECDGGDTLFDTASVCCLPYNEDRDKQETGQCMHWSRCMGTGIDSNTLRMCAPHCSKRNLHCPDAPTHDKATGFALQGVSKCSVDIDQWFGGTAPDGTLAKCIIVSPTFQNKPYQACEGLSGDDLVNCNRCSDYLHFAIESQSYGMGDPLLSLTGTAGQQARSRHVGEVILRDEWQDKCMYDPVKAAKWVKDFIIGPEQGGTNPVMRKNTVYELSNADLRTTLQCVKTPQNHTIPACSNIDCSSFNNDPRSSNYCYQKGTYNGCCRLALMEPRQHSTDEGAREIYTGWSKRK